VLAVTHVRNLLAATVIIEGGDKNKVPVKGGPSTGTISIVEKIDGRWRILRENGREVVEPTRFCPEDSAARAQTPGRSSKLASAQGRR
jgi:hypothetical protein